MPPRRGTLHAIAADGLTRTYGDLRALDGLTLRVPQGSVFGYLGPNGAGKTTTLHLLLGILKPTAGTATVAGLDVATQGAEVRRRCGALLEHHGLYERLSAHENLAFHARLFQVPRPRREERIRTTLEGLGLWERRNEPVGSWSRGMKQRLALARSMLHAPAVLFLDEPTAGLDPQAATSLRAHVRAIAAAGTTVFLTTHNLHEAEQVCDQVAVLRGGRLLAVGPPGSLRGGPRRVEVTCGRLPAKALAAARRVEGVAAIHQQGGRLLVELEGAHVPIHPLVACLVKSGVAVEGVRRVASLEADFLSLVEGA